MGLPLFAGQEAVLQPFADVAQKYLNSLATREVDPDTIRGYTN